jgi:hypothetical protein
MKKAIFIGFLAVILMIPATVLTVGAEEATQLVSAGDVSYDTPQVGPLYYYTISPCRSEDTRYWVAGCNPCPSNSYWVHNLQYRCSAVPTYADAVMVNVTAVNATGGGYLTLYAAYASKPSTSTINYGVVSGLPAIANGVIIPLNTVSSWDIEVYVYRACDWILDIMGYFS